MKQFAVIGLGNFGYFLAINLYDKGHDVLAIDKRESMVQEIKDRVTQAVVADATDLKAMQALELDQFDAVIVSIGSVLSNSILATLNLADLGVKQIHAKALNESHGRILRKIGATEVLFPEKDLAIALGERLHNPNMLDYLPFIKGYSISQFTPPEAYIGSRLKALDLINRFGVQVLAVKEDATDQYNMIPTANYKIKGGDVLVILGPDGALETLGREEEA